MNKNIIKNIIKSSLATVASAIMLSTFALPMNDFVSYQDTAILAEAAYDVTAEFASADNYATECILNGFIAPSTGEQSDYSLYSQVLNREYGYEILARELVKDKGLMAASAFWTLTNEIMDSGPIGLDSLNETQLYEVFLMDYLTYESKSAEYKSDLDTKTVKYSQKLYKTAVDMIVDNGNDLMEDTEVWKYLTIEDAQKIAAEADFCDNVIKKYTKVMGTITKIGTTAEDYLETLSKAAALNQANQERIDFLLKVKAQASDNKALCNAIDNIITQMESSFAVIAVSELGKTAGEFTVKYAWGKLSSSIPGMDAIELASGGMDLIFNTDDMATNNIKLLMMYAFKQYAERALMTSCNNYDFKTEASAAAFNGDFTAYLTYQEYVSEWAKTFASDVLLEGWFNQIKNIFSDKNKSTYDYWKNTLSYDASFCTRTQELLQKYKNLYYQIAGQTADVFDSAVIISDADEKSASENISGLSVPEYYTYCFSSAMILQKDLVINGNAIMSASVDLNGHTLTINGNLVQNGGIMKISSGTLDVNGDYTIQNKTHVDSKTKEIIQDSNGRLYMEWADGSVNVHGDFYMKSNTPCDSDYYGTGNYNYFGRGTLAIDGNFYQYNSSPGNYGSEKNFQAGGTTVKFVGSGTHEIYFESDSSYIGDNLEVPDDAKIKFTGVFHGFKLAQDIVIDGDATYDLGEMDLNGYTLTVNGDLVQNGGIMKIYGGTLNVNGDYTIQNKTHVDSKTKEIIQDSNGRLYMEWADGSVNVHGDFYMKSNTPCDSDYYGTGNYNYFGRGTLAIDGNFYQYNSSPGNYGSEKNFQVGGTTVKFVGKGTHKITSESSETKIPDIALTDGATLLFNGNFGGFDSVSSCTFSSEDTAVAKTSGNSVKSVGAGTTKLKIENTSGNSTSINLTINELVTGDANGDGKLTVADAVLLQKWLLTVPHVRLANWEACDLCEDGVINVFDLCLLKRKLVNG